MSQAISLRSDEPLSRVPAASAKVPAAIKTGEWQAWFAWRPVRLYVIGDITWLRSIYRRNLTNDRIVASDYTDRPWDYPSRP